MVRIRLRELRESRALTQTQLAELAGLTQTTISGLETDRQRARLTTVRKLADALGVEPRELIVREEMTTPARG